MARPGGCSFDILEFEHIGECKGTCGDQSEKIRFEMLDDGEVTLVVVELDLDSPEDMAKLEELLKQGNVREMTAEETREVLGKLISGRLDIEIKKMTLDEFLSMLLGEQPKPKPDDPYLTVKEAAAALGFSLSWTRALCRMGRLPGAVKLMRKWAIPQSAVFLPD
jgi:predicted DNA-binding transcriptional regulator AlpA